MAKVQAAEASQVEKFRAQESEDSEPINPKSKAVADFIQKHAESIDTNNNNEVSLHELNQFAKEHQRVVEQADLPEGVDLTRSNNKGFSWQDVKESSQFDNGKGGYDYAGAQGGANKAGSDDGDDSPSGSSIELADSKMSQWSDEIKQAAKIAGVPEEIIAGQVWAESRGNPKTSTTNPGDGNADVGLMQISNERWQSDIEPNLSSEVKAAIKEATGVDSEDLDMRNPEHNLIGGALELKSWLNKADGSVNKALAGYVSGNINANVEYVDHVKENAADARAGRKMDPYQ